ncbi:MAG: IS110 family transposase [Anaerolineae bacterium]|nr:IS110 family transposase [Anaerolineae bacterium]
MDPSRSRSKPKKPPRRKTAIPPELRHVNLDAAGIDVGSEEHYVGVPPGRDPQGQDVRHFSAFTSDLHALADWLEQCGIKTVAMESTGVYWIPLFELLEERGFEVKLVNPRHLKNVPGRKSDVLDCQWIQQLHTYGLLTGSFRPAGDICVLRSYLRQRESLVQDRARHIQHMQKALDQMNIKLHKVVSDLTGVTGLRIVRAIVAGERDPQQLARLRHGRCHKSEDEIARALEGSWREEHLFCLRQAVELFDVYSQKIADCDARLEATLSALDDRAGGAPPPKPPRRSGTNTSAPGFDAHGLLYRATGVDLTRIDGIAETTALILLTEVGRDMTRWRSEKHFASWLGLCPGNKISGGKRLSGRTKSCANRAATALRLAAQSLYHSRSALGAFYRRLRARLGAAKALTATAHKLARIVYRMLRYGTEYVDAGQDYYDQRYRERVLRGIERKARELGYNLSKINDLPKSAEAP